MKRTLVILVLISLLLLMGCPAIQMRADHERIFRLRAENIAELNRRCQGGDTQACKDGLAESVVANQTILDGLDGRGE